MLTIRLMRFGRKHQPFFRLVVVPKRGKPSRGKYIEMLGWVNPIKHERRIEHDRVRYWMSQGAQPSSTAWNLFVSEGIIGGPKKPKHKKVAPKTEEVAPQSGVASAAPDVASEATEIASATGESTEPAAGETKETPDATMETPVEPNSATTMDESA